MFLFCRLGAAGVSLASVEPLPVRVQVQPEKVFQTIDGFGASDAWSCDVVGRNWPEEKRGRMADLLFSRETDAQGNPKGIGLSIWRFNLGAGTAGQGEASGITNPWRRTGCFQKADGSFDWSAQSGQQWFLRAARGRGVEKFLLFPNSPPVHLTRNGKGYADKGPPKLNLQPGKLGDYARFMAGVLEHFEKEGLPFDYLSPVNEPQWEWDDASQEGTPALNGEIYELVRQLSQELASRRLRTRIVIGEAGTIGHAALDMSAFGLPPDGRDQQAGYFFGKSSPYYIGGLPHVEPILSAHSYQSVWPVDKQIEYRQLTGKALQAANPDLGFWQSEYCVLEENGETGGGSRRDLGMKTALFVARLIHHDLTLLNARSWQWWTALSQVDFKDGLIYLDDGSLPGSGRMGPEILSLQQDGEWRDSKLLWVLGNFSRFIRPGMVRVGCTVSPPQSAVDGLLVSAYRSPDGSQAATVAVLVNLSEREVPCDLGPGRDWEVFTTSANSSLVRSRHPGLLVIPPRAVVTCVLAAPKD